MQSWNSKGMESINEVKVKAPGRRGGKWSGFVDHGDWNFGQDFQFRHSMGRVEVRNGWGHEGRAAKVKGWTFRTVSWSGSRGHRAGEKKTVWLIGAGGKGWCVLTVRLAFILKWSWEDRGGCLAHAPGICSARQLKVGVVTGEEGGQAEEMKRNNDREKRIRRLAPGTGRFRARRGRASLRRTDSWCSACSPPGSSRLSPGGQTRLTIWIKPNHKGFARSVSSDAN